MSNVARAFAANPVYPLTAEARAAASILFEGVDWNAVFGGSTDMNMKLAAERLGEILPRLTGATPDDQAALACLHRDMVKAGAARAKPKPKPATKLAGPDKSGLGAQSVRRRK